MVNLITENLDNILLAGGGIIAYFGGRKLKATELKKETATAKELEAGALTSMQNAYNEFVVDQKERYNEIKAELIYCREEIKILRSQSDKLKGDIVKWVNKYNELRKQFELYKKKHN